MQHSVKNSSKVTKQGTGGVDSPLQISLIPIISFGLIFAALGTYFLSQSFASTVTSTFGKTSVGSTCDTFINDSKRVNKYTVNTTATVTKLSVYLKPGSASGSQSIKGILYADNGGSPGALIASTNQLTYANTNNANWYDLNFQSPSTINAGNYWIGVITGATARVAGYCYDSVTNARDYNTNTYGSGPSNPYGSVNLDDRVMSLYATYSWDNGNSSPPTASLTASPSTIHTGQSSELTWSSSNATTCSASWTGSTATSGSQSVAPSSSTIYRITCSGSGGNTTAQASVTVISPSPTPPPPSPPPPSGGNNVTSSPNPSPPTNSSPTTTQTPAPPNNKSVQHQQLYAVRSSPATSLQRLIAKYGITRVAIGFAIVSIVLASAIGFGIRRWHKTLVSTADETPPTYHDLSLPLPIGPPDLPPFPFL